MSEGNEALAHRFHMDIFQEGTLDAADEILSPEFVWHGAFSPGEDQRGPQPTKQVTSVVISAFPDRRITHEDTVAEGDKVLIRWTMNGTQEGEFAGVAPTGRRVTLTGFDLFRIEDGKIVEMWQEADRLGMMQQLGVVPRTGTGWKLTPCSPHIPPKECSRSHRAGYGEGSNADVFRVLIKHGEVVRSVNLTKSALWDSGPGRGSHPPVG